MTDVNHSQVLVGSRHAIHNLTYPNAVYRAAGTNEGKGIVVDATNLWQVAKQDDDNSYWFLSGVAPLAWVQIATATVANLDFGYDAFGGPGTVNIDAGSLTWAPAGAYDFIINLSSSDDPLGGEGGTYYGLYVNNGTDNFQVVRAAADQVDVRGTLNDFIIDCAGRVEFDIDEDLKVTLQNDLASGNYVGIINDGSSGLSANSGEQNWLDLVPRIEQSGTAGYNAIRVNLTEVSTGSGVDNLLRLIVGGADQFVVKSDGNTQIGTGTPGVATGAGDLYVTGKLEVDGIIKADAGVDLGTNYSLRSAIYQTLTGSIGLSNTNQTNVSGFLYTGTTANHWIVAEIGDIAFDFAHAQATDPTLFIHSASQSTTEWIGFYHDQTYGRIETGAGAVCIGNGVPGEATATNSLYVTDKLEVDGTARFDNTVSCFGGAIQTGTSTVIRASSYPTASGSVGLSNNNQTNLASFLYTGTTANMWVMCEVGDIAFDFAHAQATDPFFIIHSASQSTTEWIGFYHDQTYGRIETGAGAVCVGTGTPAIATGAGDLYVTSDVEIGGLAAISGNTVCSGHVLMGTSSKFMANADQTTSGSIGLSNDNQTNISSFLYTGTTANHWIIAEQADSAFNFAHALATDPTLIGHSANQSTTEFWSLTHNQTDAVFASGAGALSLAPASGVIKYPDAGQTLYDIAPASDHTATGDTVSATVDTNPTGFAAALYQAADGNWDEADADALATMPCRALALETGTGTKLILRRGWIRDDTWAWTPGAPVYVSTTAGALTQTKPSGTGDQVQIVGYAETADILDFNPSTVIVEVA
jgi:hypothetical protein